MMISNKRSSRAKFCFFPTFEKTDSLGKRCDYGSNFEYFKTSASWL